MKKVTKKTMWIFALGQLGWSILAGIISNLLVNFYQPDAGSGLSTFVVQGSIFLGLTVIGIITAIGRVFDAVTDPLIANASDRSKNKLGKRIPFLRYSAVPFALVTVLVFCAPVNGESWVNILWLFITLMVFYISMTAYCTPYNALIPVLGKEQKDRMDISTYISITYLLGTGIAFSAKMLWSALSTSTGLEYYLSARIVLALLAVIALICMLIPAFLINEKDYESNEAVSVQENAFKSLGKTFKNKHFRLFVLSDILYWVGITIFNTGFLYYVENLLNIPDMYMILFIFMTLLSFLCYIPVNILTKKIGKKPMVITGFILFAFAFLITGIFAGRTEPVISNKIFGFIVSALVGIPLSILGVVPQAIVADIAEEDSIATNENHDGMFFAARTFAFKMGQGVAMLVFTSLAIVGNVVNEEGTVVSNDGTGYRLSLYVAMAMSILAAITLLFYNEKKVMKQINDNHSLKASDDISK